MPSAFRRSDGQIQWGYDAIAYYDTDIEFQGDISPVLKCAASGKFLSTNGGVSWSIWSWGIQGFLRPAKTLQKKNGGRGRGFGSHFSDLFWIFYCDLLFVSIVWPFQLTRYLKPFSEHDILESVELFNGLHRGPPTFLETIETENLMDCWGLLLRMFAIQTENMIVWDFKTNSALLCHDL